MAFTTDGRVDPLHRPWRAADEAGKKYCLCVCPSDSGGDVFFVIGGVARGDPVLIVTIVFLSRWCACYNPAPFFSPATTHATHFR